MVPNLGAASFLKDPEPLQMELVSLSLSPFSLSLLLALSLTFCLSIFLFSPVATVFRCVSAGLCHLVSLCVTHACALVLFLFFLYTHMYIPKLASLHPTPLVWLYLRQLFGEHFSHPLFALFDTCCCHHSELAFLPESLC